MGPRHFEWRFRAQYTRSSAWYWAGRIVLCWSPWRHPRSAFTGTSFDGLGWFRTCDQGTCAASPRIRPWIGLPQLSSACFSKACVDFCPCMRTETGRLLARSRSGLLLLSFRVFRKSFPKESVLNLKLRSTIHYEIVKWKPTTIIYSIFKKDTCKYLSVCSSKFPIDLIYREFGSNHKV